MKTTLATRIAAIAAVGTITATGVVAIAAPAQAVDQPCVSSIRVIAEGVTEAKAANNAQKVLRKVTLPANKKAWNNQLSEIASSNLSSKWKSRLTKATNIEYKAIRDWRVVETAAQIFTYGAIEKFYVQGNQTACLTIGSWTNFQTAIDSAITAEQAALTQFENSGNQLVPNYVAAMEKAFNKWNNSTLTVKSTKAFLKQVVNNTKQLVIQAGLIPATFYASDKANQANYTNALNNL